MIISTGIKWGFLNSFYLFVCSFYLVWEFQEIYPAIWFLSYSQCLFTLLSLLGSTDTDLSHRSPLTLQLPLTSKFVMDQETESWKNQNVCHIVSSSSLPSLPSGTDPKGGLLNFPMVHSVHCPHFFKFQITAEFLWSSNLLSGSDTELLFRGNACQISPFSIIWVPVGGYSF